MGTVLQFPLAFLTPVAFCLPVQPSTKTYFVTFILHAIDTFLAVFVHVALQLLSGPLRVNQLV